MHTALTASPAASHDTATSSPVERTPSCAPRPLSRRRAWLERRTAEEQHVLQHVAHALKAARARRGWTQRELARRSGIDSSHIALLEVGADNVTVLTLGILARTLRCSVATLVRGA